MWYYIIRLRDAALRIGRSGILPKYEKEINTMKDTKTTSSNPFNFAPSDVLKSESRKLDYTPNLIAKSNDRAQELMLQVGKRPELHDLANAALDNGEPTDLIKLIESVFGSDTIKTDAKLLEGADDYQLQHLLDSRRSDRSKAKAKGTRTSVGVCKTYISSMYAELLVRDIWNKPYTGSTTELDIDALSGDRDAVTRKIKSLQSKKSRLNKLATYDTDAASELEEVEAEIARLNELRPSTRATAKTVVKDIKVDELREALKSLDINSMPEDDQAKLLELMAKLG